MWKATMALLLVGSSAMGCSKEASGDKNVATSEGAIGIAECDAYVEKMTAFLDTLPADARAAREPGFKTMRASWQEAAKNPTTKENLAATCKAQLANLPPSAPAK